MGWLVSFFVSVLAHYPSAFIVHEESLRNQILGPGLNSLNHIL